MPAMPWRRWPRSSINPWRSRLNRLPLGVSEEGAKASAAVDALAAGVLTDLFQLLQQEGYQRLNLVIRLAQFVHRVDQRNHRRVMTAPPHWTAQIAGVGDA